MRILLVGSTGMVGHECEHVLERNHEIIKPDKKELDIISWDAVIQNLQRISPHVILNCAGFTDVDASEKEDFAVRKINVEGPRNLAQGAARFQSKLVHISSDYVFDGQKPMPQPYFEDDAPNPLSAYGKSKLESEVAVRENAPNFLIVRTGWLYGIGGKNFVKAVVQKALKETGEPLRMFDDQFGSPTWAYRFGLQIKELIEHEARGTYHATAEDYCSRFECARYLVKRLGLKASVEACTLKDLPEKAPRPSNCLLENRLLKKQGINIMRNWKEDLDSFLDQYGEQIIREAEREAA